MKIYKKGDSFFIFSVAYPGPFFINDKFLIIENIIRKGTKKNHHIHYVVRIYPGEAKNLIFRTRNSKEPYIKRFSQSGFSTLLRNENIKPATEVQIAKQLLLGM